VFLLSTGSEIHLLFGRRNDNKKNAALEVPNGSILGDIFGSNLSTALEKQAD